MEPELSIVIVNWNTSGLLRDCLNSLGPAMNRVPTEVVVVDNDSSDDSVEVCRREFPWVKLIVNDSNEGFGRANNIGVEASAGRFVLLLNSDTIVYEDSLAGMVQALEDDETIGCLGCRLLNADGTIQRSAMRFPALRFLTVDQFMIHRIFKGMHWAYVEPPYVNRQIPCGWVVGAAMIMRREAFDQAGGFDPRIWMYGEERELCYRIKLAGWKIVFDPAVNITHLGEGSWDRDSGSTRHLRLAGLIYFFKLHKSALACLVARVLVTAGSLIRMGLWSVVWVVKSDRRKEALAEIKAHLSFMRGKFSENPLSAGENDQ